MENKVAFELVSPERLLVSREVDMVVVPGSEGLFGVLPGHAPFISGVRPGVIEIHEGGVVDERIFVGGGFAEVTPERCTVMAEEAVSLADLDRSAIETQIKDLKDELPDIVSEEEREALDARIGLAEAKLQALFAHST